MDRETLLLTATSAVTSVSAVAVLLARTGSGFEARTSASAVMRPGGTVASTTIVIVLGEVCASGDTAASEETVQVTTPPDWLHDQPGPLALTKVTPDGRVISDTTSKAGAGPALVTV